jgi:hypothetical protein
MNNTPSPRSNIQQIVRAKRKIVYVAPDTGMIEELAHQVCTTLGEQHEVYRDPQVVNGLATFLTMIAHLTAKSFTAGKRIGFPSKRRKK